MDLITYIFLIWVAPIWFFVSIGILALLMVLIPHSAWVLTKSRLAKNASIGILASDDGVLRFEILESVAQGLFKSKDGKRRYFFLPRPKFSDDSGLSNPGTITWSLEDKRAMDQDLLKRHVIGDIKKVAYLGYTGKCVVGPPSVLDQLEVSDDLQMMADESNKPVADVKAKIQNYVDKIQDQKKRSYPIEAHWAHAMDPRKWKDYLKLALNQSALDSLCYTHEQIGLEGRPASKKMGVIIIILIIIGIGALAYLFLTGQFSTAPVKK